MDLKSDGVFFFRISYLTISASLLLFARIFPFFKDGYKEYVEITNRVRISYLTNICAIESSLLAIFGASFLIIQRLQQRKSSKKQSQNERNEDSIRRISWAFTIKKMKRIYFWCIANLCSLNCTMAVSYWLLFFYDKEMIEKTNDKTNYSSSKFLSLTDHTLPALINLSEAFIIKSKYDLTSFITSLVLAVLYFTLIVIVNRIYGTWPYGMFLNKSYFTILMMVIAFLSTGNLVTFLLLKLFRVLHSRSRGFQASRG